jgi:hypothetical protein
MYRPLGVSRLTGESFSSEAAVRMRCSRARAYRNGFRVEPACRAARAPSTAGDRE